MRLKFRGKQHELCELLACLCHHGRRKVTRVATYLFNDGPLKGCSFSAEGDHMALVVKDTDVPGTVDVVISFKDAKGNLAKVDGVPTWAASDPSIIDTVTPTEDGLAAKLHITDTIGASQLTVTADVDMGSGVTSTDFVDTVSVIAGDAVKGEFTFGTVTPDPVTPPPGP